MSAGSIDVDGDEVLQLLHEVLALAVSAAVGHHPGHLVRRALRPLDLQCFLADEAHWK